MRVASHYCFYGHKRVTVTDPVAVGGSGDSVENVQGRLMQLLLIAR